MAENLSDGMLALVNIGGASASGGSYTITFGDYVDGPYDYATVIKILGEEAMIRPEDARELLGDAFRTGRRAFQSGFWTVPR